MSSEPDFIIVGGGTAGLALATRLSEDPSKEVLVLEAGESQLNNFRVNTPALWPSLLATDCDWNDKTVPQEALGGKQIGQPHGRMLGGTSALNGMAFVATSKLNVDAWAALGNPGWDWEKMAPYYQKTYTVNLPEDDAVRTQLALDYMEDHIKGTSGPIQTSFPDDLNDPIPKAWLDTFKELGYSISGDPFSGVAFGAYTNSASINPDRTRSYSANAYYAPIKDSRPNLKVVTSALVEKVELEKDDSGNVIATGVQYTKDATSITAKAKREVIVSGGTYNSPKILELSGIGDAELLSSYGIPVFVDNPNVGAHLQDHTLGGLSFEVVDGVATKDDMSRQDRAALGAAMEAYTKHRKGPFTVGGNFSSALLPVPDFLTSEGKTELESLLTIPSSWSSPAPKDPGAAAFDRAHTAFIKELLRNPAEASAGYFTYAAQSNFRGSGTGADAQSTKLPGNYVTIAVSLLHPLSRGTVHIQSADPSEPPAIDPQYLAHPLDVEVLARHVRYIETIASTPPFSNLLKPLGVGRRNLGVPQNDLRKASLDEVKEYVKSAALTTFHPTSTCAMIPREMGGVVDSRLRVHGVKGLRVVDASVIPINTRGNTQTSVYAIAEKAADLIKEDLGIGK
ncbi:GMC oxidoreductase [Patellaria atrata CBS 101060]|uniref:GMC oxidoreductase n=1 Tax=Patellaria atrata CBS 101060 TaxID=1346257 RepID=A0A9P4SAC6_9PEZI|nr:GMC oxidoreductase [Patellaria atrata CBS 101060]